MKIAIACDHGGISFKEKLTTYLQKAGHEVQDFGCNNQESCDYPDYGIPASQAVSTKNADRAILVCSNGIGMSMLANKTKGILAALVYSESSARMTRQHHDSNILCLGAKEFSGETLLNFVKIWMTTDFQAGRHQRRQEKIKALEKS